MTSSMSIATAMAASNMPLWAQNLFPLFLAEFHDADGDIKEEDFDELVEGPSYSSAVQHKSVSTS